MHERAGANVQSHAVGAAGNRAGSAGPMRGVHQKDIPGDAVSVPRRSEVEGGDSCSSWPRATRAGWQERKQMTVGAEGPLATSELDETLVCSEKISGSTVAWTGAGSGQETPHEL